MPTITLRARRTNDPDEIECSFEVARKEPADIQHRVLELFEHTIGIEILMDSAAIRFVVPRRIYGFVRENLTNDADVRAALWAGHVVLADEDVADVASAAVLAMRNTEARAARAPVVQQAKEPVSPCGRRATK